MATTVQNNCSCPSKEVVLVPGPPGDPALTNPIMHYDKTLGTPTVQGITPPVPTLPALIYEKNAADKTYSWNVVAQQWQVT